MEVLTCKLSSNLPWITGLQFTSGLAVLKMQNGPMSKNSRTDPISTPKMNLSRHSVGEPRVLMVQNLLPVHPIQSSKWQQNSCQNQKISRVVLLKVKSSKHLISITNGIALQTYAMIIPRSLQYWKTELAFFSIGNPYDSWKLDTTKYSTKSTQSMRRYGFSLNWQQPQNYFCSSLQAAVP